MIKVDKKTKIDVLIQLRITLLYKLTKKFNGMLNEIEILLKERKTLK